jgi:hypothetical protein
VRFFDRETYDRFLTKPSKEIAANMEDPTAVSIRGLTSEKDFNTIVQSLKSDVGRLVQVSYSGPVKNPNGSNGVFGWVRFGHPDKAKKVREHKWGRTTAFPRLRFGRVAPLWSRGEAPDGAFKGESVSVDSGFGGFFVLR